MAMPAKLLGPFALIASLLALSEATAQFDLDASDEPIVIEADNGMEWLSEKEKLVAQGNVRASRGESTVSTDILTAFYRETENTETEFYRLEADGAVILSSPGGTATGDRAVYDLDRAVVVLTGRALRLTLEDETITASDSLEYWSRRKLAVARGDARAQAGPRTIRADLLTASFENAADGGVDPVRMNATGNVVIVTSQDIARGDQCVYDIKRRTAKLTGNVKITRGETQLNGAIAEINLRTGVSRLLADPGGQGRVRGLFVPKRKSAKR